MEEKIKAKLDELRVGLQADGGDLELVKIEGKVVYLNDDPQAGHRGGASGNRPGDHCGAGGLI